MKRNNTHQVVPAIIMAAAAAVPIITTAEILTHVPISGTGVAIPATGPVAVAFQGSSSAVQPSASSGSNGTHTYVGAPVNQPYGPVQGSITVTGVHMSAVLISAPHSDPRSAGINQQAIPLLVRETLQAQSAHVAGVSGATLTSTAYVQSLQAALDQARNQGVAIAGGPTSSQLASAAPAGAAQKPAVSISRDD